LETYSGKAAETLTARDFVAFGWSEKEQFLRFLRWTGEIRHYAGDQEQK
jgi:hypothetical protein